MGGDRPPSATTSTSCCFNPRPRVGGDFRIADTAAARSSFQSAPPRGGRPVPVVFGIRVGCFNPRPRVGGDPCNDVFRHALDVSIRAPAWGATTPSRRPWLVSCVSIRAPAWGATRDRGEHRRDGQNVSIRAPAWGATGPVRPTCLGGASFNPRPRVGGDMVATIDGIDVVAFQSAPPRGGRRPRPRRAGAAARVSIRAPAWGATRGSGVPKRSIRVSIRAPAWGATSAGLSPLSCKCCFNPRPRVGGDALHGRRLVDVQEVSIRAPAWGATCLNARAPRVVVVSIRAPAWGATGSIPAAGVLEWSFNPRPRVGGDLDSLPTLVFLLSFNPRPRVGGDPAHARVPQRLAVVSIRAPAWGATRATGTAPTPCSSFNPRPRVGGDGGLALVELVLQVSIRAPAWGATHGPRHRDGLVAVSIRAPAWGATSVRSTRFAALEVSIRAPAWGATSHVFLHRFRCCVSIRAPAWGATVRAALAHGLREVSIRAPAWGATRTQAFAESAVPWFQSAPPRGGRQGIAKCKGVALGRFNPRPRVGGDSSSRRSFWTSTPFQSAPPRGGRPVPRTIRWASGCFNPRPRVGGDPAYAPTIPTRPPFQSAPPRGGRPPRPERASRSNEFQSAPPRGGRPAGSSPSTGTTRSFNPRPRVGGDSP